MTTTRIPTRSPALHAIAASQRMVIRTSTKVCGASSRRDAESEGRALAHTGGHAQPHLVRRRDFAGAAACRRTISAQISPRPAAPRAGPPKRHMQGDEHTPECFLRADHHFGRQKGLSRHRRKRNRASGPERWRPMESRWRPRRRAIPCGRARSGGHRTIVVDPDREAPRRHETLRGRRHPGHLRKCPDDNAVPAAGRHA